jgi:hypothetical protein
MTIELDSQHTHVLNCALSIAIQNSKGDTANPYRDMQVTLCELAGIDIHQYWVASGAMPPPRTACQACTSWNTSAYETNMRHCNGCGYDFGVREDGTYVSQDEQNLDSKKLEDNERHDEFEKAAEAAEADNAS